MTHARGEPLESFIARLSRIEPVLRIITRDAPLSVLFIFREDPEGRVLLDLSKRPCRVVTGDEAAGAHVTVAIRRRMMHRVFSGDLTAAQALSRRELLLRGSAFHITRFIPLFDLAVPLYRDHFRPEKSTENPMHRSLERGVHIAAYTVGYSLGLLRYRWLPQIDLFEVVEAISRGLDDAENRVKGTSEPGREPG